MFKFRHCLKRGGQGRRRGGGGMSSGVYKCQLLNKLTLLNELFLLNWPTGPIQSQSLDVCLLIYIYINCKFDSPKIGFFGL